MIPEGGNIGDHVAEYIDLHQAEAVFQSINVGDLVVVHIHMGQGLKILQGINGGQGIIGTIDGFQSGAVRPLGQGGDLNVAGEIKVFQLRQNAEGCDIGDVVAGDAQVCQIGIGGQQGYVGQLVVVCLQ